MLKQCYDSSAICGIALAVVLLLSRATVAPAAVKNWLGGSGNWGTAGNWNGATLPNLGDTVNIVFTDGIARTVTYDVSAPSLNLVSVDLTGGAGTTASLVLPNNTNLAANGLWVGGYSGTGVTNGRGLLNQSTGQVTMNPGWDLVMGHGANSMGTYLLSGGSLTANQSEYLGLSGSGTLDHSAGTNTIHASAVGTLAIGILAGASGTYNLSGTGLLSSNTTEYIGLSGVGVFNQTGGAHYLNDIGHHLYLGYAADGLGTYTLSAGTLNPNYGDEYVGFAGTGNANQSGGTFSHSGGINSMGGDLVLGYNSGATGTYTLNGGGSLSAASVVVGRSGTGTLTQSGGAITVRTGGLNIGAVNGGSGTYTLSGGSASVPNGVNVGVAGTGVLNVSGTGLLNISTATLNINNSAGSSVNLSGGSISAFALNFGGTPSRFHWTGGALSLTTNVTWDSAAAATSTSAAFGSSLSVGNNQSLNAFGNETLGGGGTFGLTLQGAGAHYVGGNLTVNPTGALTIRDQALVHVANQLSIVGGAVNLEGGTLRFNGYFNTGSFNYSAGTIQLAGDRSVGSDSTIQALFGVAPTISTGKRLAIEGTATLLTPLTLNGGTFSAANLINPQLLQVQDGTLDVTAQARTIGSGEVLELASNAVINYGQGITNEGLIKGDGQLGGALFQNSSVGEVLAEFEKSLAIAALNNVNDGKMSLAGGSLQFAQQLANQPGGIISGHGTLIANGGLINYGTMSFTEVANVVSGNIVSLGQVTVAPGAAVNFDSPSPVELGGLVEVNHGTIAATNGIVFGTPQMRAEANDILDVITLALREDYLQRQADLAAYTEELRQAGHLGQENGEKMLKLQNLLSQRQAAIQAATNLVVRLACPPHCVVANMRSTLIADTELLGRFVPGGPAEISSVDVVGDLSVALRSEMEFEMAGTGPGQFDALLVDGNVSFEFGARIVLSMLDPSDPQNGTNLFLPEPGDFFDVVTADAIDAEFLLIEAPEFDNRTFVAGVFDGAGGQVLRITVVPVGLEGDYNENGVVDAADYTVWRDNLGSGASLPNDDTAGVGPGDYDVWKTHFGDVLPGSGAGSSSSFRTAVPEPSSMVLFLTVALTGLMRRTHRMISGQTESKTVFAS